MLRKIVAGLAIALVGVLIVVGFSKLPPAPVCIKSHVEQRYDYGYGYGYGWTYSYNPATGKTEGHYGYGYGYGYGWHTETICDAYQKKDG